MAQYEVYIPIICETSEKFKKMAIDLDFISQRIGSVISVLQEESIPEFKSRLINEKEAIVKASLSANKIGQILNDVSDIYYRAEGAMFADNNAPQRLPTPIVASHIIKPFGLLLFRDLIMPDWLQIAIIKYEQSQT